jgi:hypothetical protein
MAARAVQTQIELGLAGRQTIPSGGFQYLQPGAVMRPPPNCPISRALRRDEVFFTVRTYGATRPPYDPG